MLSSISSTVDIVNLKVTLGDGLLEEFEREAKSTGGLLGTADSCFETSHLSPPISRACSGACSSASAFSESASASSGSASTPSELASASSESASASSESASASSE